MAITPETLRRAQDMKDWIQTISDELALDLTRAWVGAWDALQPEIEDTLLALMAEHADRVPRSALTRSERLVSALQQAEDTLAALYARTADEATRLSIQAIGESIAAQQRILASQLPPDYAGTWLGLGFNLDAPHPDAVNALIARVTQQIHAETMPLAPWVTQRMKDQLMRGIIVGENPRAVARRIISATEDQFNGGLARALNISRTEMLDANRRAALLAAEQNRDLLTGWVWICTLDSRTCPSCLSNHGTLHPVDEFGPIDHQQGRCDRVDKAKSWKELGFDIEEPEDSVPDAMAWYDGLTEDTQLRIMGPTRKRLLDEGKISWDDLSELRKTPNWRDSRGVTPVRDLLTKAGENA